MSNNYIEGQDEDEERDDEQPESCPEPNNILRGRTEDLPDED
jgi:hypothetical protein